VDYLYSQYGDIADAKYPPACTCLAVSATAAAFFVSFVSITDLPCTAPKLSINMGTKKETH